MARNIRSLLPVLQNRNVRRRSSKRDKSAVMTTYMLVFAVCGVLLLVGLTKIYLERQTTKLGQLWLQRKQELEVVLKERQNLLIEREHQMSGEHILERAGRMGLRPPLPGQVRKMSNPADDGSAVAGQTP